MSIGGGVDRDFLRPSNANKPNTIGDHRGSFEALNVKNPQPGMRYIHENCISGGGSRVLSRLNQGYQLVRPGDPEQAGGMYPITAGSLGNDVRAFGDVVLMRIPLTLYAKLQAEAEQITRAAQNQAEENFRDKGETLKARMGNSAPSEDLYYARQDHFTQEE